MALNPNTVTHRLEQATRRWKASQGAKFLLAGGGAALAQLVVFLGLDTWFHFGAAARWATFSLFFGSLLAGALCAWRVWAPKVSLASMARRLEIASGDRSNTLINAVHFDQALPGDSPLRAAIFSEMSDPFPQVRWDVVLDRGLLQRLAFGLGGAALALFVFAAVMPLNVFNSALRILLPASNIQPLTRTRISSLHPGNDSVPHGRDVHLQVTLAGEVPKSAWVRYREAGGSWQRSLLEHEAGQSAFTFTWKEVKQPLEYEVQAGDVESPRHRISVRPRTVLKTVAAEIVPPSYTGLPTSTVPVTNALQGVPAGAQVRLRLAFNNSLVECKASAEGEQVFAVESASPTEWSVAFDSKTVRALRIAFRDESGVSELLNLPVEVRPDEPPKVVVLAPEEGRELFAEKGARLALTFTAADSLGLGFVGLYQEGDDPEHATLLQEFGSAVGAKSWEGSVSVTVAPLAEESRVTYKIVARDANDVTGPGTTQSRPIVVQLKSAAKLAEAKQEAQKKIEAGVEALIGLQSKNLDETRALILKKGQATAEALLERQMKVASMAGELSVATGGISPEVHVTLERLLEREMKEAVLALREAGSAEGEERTKQLVQASGLEAAILGRLKGTPDALQEEAKRAEVEAAISALESLFKEQRAIFKDTKTKGRAESAPLAKRQDALAERVPGVRQSLLTDSKNAGMGDADLRRRFEEVSGLLGELKVYEGMLGAVEHLEAVRVPEALKKQEEVLAALAKLAAMLNDWQKKEAQEKRDELKEKLSEFDERLRNLADVQKDIVEKTKEMARKTELRPDDVAQMDELKKTKDLVKEALEQMTTDMQAFPDTKAGNEMKDALMQVFEDVEQEDLEDVLSGNKKPTEIAVQKEQGMLDALEKAKEISGDMEHWLATKMDTTKWLMENFDKSEMPEIPMLPLADAFEDLVGDLLEQQQNIAEDVKSSASNQALAEIPPGWDVMDGVMPAFGAQGKSGNQAPKHNEQMGRSSGGREGMSDGEMAGTETQMLKGDTPDARRTNDGMQQGQVRDNGEVGQTRATGGGKAGGFSDRNGMEGNAPVRAVQSDKKPADALAVQQAMLAEKTAQKTAEAAMLYIKSDGLREVAKVMAQAAQALKEGRGQDATSLHQRVVRQLKELQGGVQGNEVLARASASGKSEERKLQGGNEGDAPAAYKAMVADYFKALGQEK
jgi:hypothetical protein